MSNNQDQKPATGNQAAGFFRRHKKPIIIAATIAGAALAYDAFAACGSPCPSAKYRWNPMTGVCGPC
jgi:hypothetical protein